MGARKIIPHLYFGQSPEKTSDSEPQINVGYFSPEATLAYIEEQIHWKRGFALATLNLDHIVKLSANPQFLEAYQQHDAVVADGFPIAWLGRLNGADVQRTTGSDLTIPIIRLVWESDASLAIIGTSAEILARASETLKEKFPGLKIVFTHAPQFGFDPLSAEARQIIAMLAESKATICLLALGAPKQEIFAAEAKRVLPSVGLVSVGAAIDFIAGAQKRAPLWVQKINMEWFWRMATNPKRLLGRYWQCALAFPVLLVRGFRQKLSGQRL